MAEFNQNNIEEIPLDQVAKASVEDIPLESLAHAKSGADDWEEINGPGILRQAGQYALEKVGKASRFFDSVTGAPVRAAVGAMQEGKNPREVGSAAYEQFGKNPDLAPTGKDIAKKFGVPDTEFDTGIYINPFTHEQVKTSPAGLVGTGVDVALDPTTYLTGALGGALEKSAAATVGKLEPKITEYLSQKAAERAVKAGTGQSIKDIRRIAKSSTKGAIDLPRAEANLRSTGEELLRPNDQGERVVGWFDRPEEIAPKANARKGEFGQQIGDVGKSIDQTTPAGAVSGWSIAKDLQDYASSIPEVGAGKGLKARLESEIENLKMMGNLSFEEAQKIKNQFKWEPQAPDALISNKDVTNQINQIISKNMEDAASQAGKLGEYQEAKKGYGSMLGVEQAASDRAMKNLSNRFISPSDYGVGGVGAMTAAASGHGAMAGLSAVAGAAANKIIRERGSAFVANSLRKLAEITEKAPEFLGKYKAVLERASAEGARSLAVTHHLLLNNDPMYRKLFDEDYKNNN